MTLATWLTVVTICALGAMSPGPSLAVVLRHTLGGGGRQGAMAALAHGLGIGLYALACISGLAFVLIASPRLYAGFQWAGAAYLAWLGLRGLFSKPGPRAAPDAPASHAGAARDGFLIAFLNPKAAVFFVALFSQVIGADTDWLAKLGYALTALVIDTGWYLLVAWLFSRPGWLARFRGGAVWVERLFGLLLLGLAGRLVWLNWPGA